MNKILFIGGILLLLLPIGLRFWEEMGQHDFVSTYEKEVEELDLSELEMCLKEAHAYNETFYLTGELDEKIYENQLNLFGNGIMGSIEIPRINVKLPIYHGTEEEILTNGIGHLKESGLPVGTENSHAVLTGHRGLPNAQLFTRLDELEIGDVFWINTCGNEIVFHVKDIQVVRPEEVEVLEIQPGEKLVSLVTCTPYGINTHRLVVTGEQYEEVVLEDLDVEVDVLSNRDLVFLAVPIFLAGIGIVIHWRKEVTS